MSISVKKLQEDEKTSVFQVMVGKGSSSTSHEVVLEKKDQVRLGYETPEKLVKKSFEFLLTKESKESILSKFNLMDISKYFSDYEVEIKKK